MLAFILWLLDSLRAALGRLAGEPSKTTTLADKVAPAGQPGASRAIEAIGGDGRAVKYQATGVFGLMLVCRQIDSTEVRYIDAGQTSDVPGFYRVWKELGGMGQGLMVDGEPFDPSC